MKNRLRTIGGAVVDENELKRRIGLRENGVKQAMHHFAMVVAGSDDADKGQIYSVQL